MARVTYNITEWLKKLKKDINKASECELKICTNEKEIASTIVPASYCKLTLNRLIDSLTNKKLYKTTFYLEGIQMKPVNLTYRNVNIRLFALPIHSDFDIYNLTLDVIIDNVRVLDILPITSEDMVLVTDLGNLYILSISKSKVIWRVPIWNFLWYSLREDKKKEEPLVIIKGMAYTEKKIIEIYYI